MAEQPTAEKDARFQCPPCGEKFHTPEELKRHAEEHHAKAHA